VNSKRIQMNSLVKQGIQCRISKKNLILKNKTNWNSGNEKLNKSNKKISSESLSVDWIKLEVGVLEHLYKDKGKN
jgi:hypothetical protein